MTIGQMDQPKVAGSDGHPGGIADLLIGPTTRSRSCVRSVTMAGRCSIRWYGMTQRVRRWSERRRCFRSGRPRCIALTTLLSVLIGSSAGAAGVGIGAYALVSIAATWKPLGTYSPAALTTVPNSLLAGKDVAVMWPVLTSLLLAAAPFALAARAFRRSEL
jgi:hypothetical protein